MDPAVVLRGQLVRVATGAEWDLLTPNGHAGLVQAFRRFENREVVITVSEPVPADEAGGELEGLAGIGPEVGPALQRAGFGTVEDLRRASDSELLAIPGIGKATLRKIREQIQ